MSTAPQPTVFVPGFPGSVLIDAFGGNETVFPPTLGNVLLPGLGAVLRRLHGPDNFERYDGIEIGGPIRHKFKLFGFPVSDEANGLYEVLADLGYDLDSVRNVYPVGWDWRRPVYAAETQRRVRGAIDALFEESGAPVTLIVHSTGGLVLRALLAAQPEVRARIRRVVALGIPWAGTLKSMRMIALGESFGAGRVSAERTREVIGRSWAAYDLLPPDPNNGSLAADQRPPALAASDAGDPVAPLRNTTWLEREDAERRRARARAADGALGRRGRDFLVGDLSDLEVINILAWGCRTDVVANVHDDGADKPVTFIESNDGDGTIPAISAAWIAGENVRTFRVPYGSHTGAPTGKHSQLWKAPMAKAVLERYLLDRPPAPFVFAAGDPDDMLAERRRHVAIRVAAVDDAGKALPGARAFFKGFGRRRDRGHTDIDPATGTATLRAERDGDKRLGNAYLYRVVVEWTDDGETLSRTVDISFF